MPLPQRASTLLIGLVLWANQVAWAQQAPSAGSQLQQIPAPMPRPAAKPEQQTPIDESQVGTDADTAKVLVKDLLITGVRSLEVEELIRVSGFAPGSSYSLAELRAMAAKITAHYRRQGYLLTQTYLPTQDVTDGHVRLAVVEGQYGQITLQNQSGLHERVARSLLDGLQVSDAITTAALERRVLLLSDLPGIQVKSVLKPGANVGTSDLLVELTPGQRVGGGLEADNGGNRYTGANRVGASLFVNEPFGLGDVASARLLTSGEGLSFARLAYQAQAGTFSVGAAYTAMTYQLGGDFASSQSTGSARITSVFASYPWLRGRDHNLSAQGSFDNKDLSDQSGTGLAASTSDKTSQIGTLGLKGDFRDAMGNGFNNYTVSWTHGNLSLRMPAVLAIDAQTAQTAGSFDKLLFGLSRLQDLTADTGLYVSVNGQLASKNLDASEKLSLGGLAGVRAYPSGEASGDDGVLLSVETRTRLPSLAGSLAGQWQWVGFVDAGWVRLNKNPWDISNPANSRRLVGAGVGLNYVGDSNWLVKASCAFKLGDEAATSAPDAGWRFWLQLNKTF